MSNVACDACTVDACSRAPRAELRTSMTKQRSVAHRSPLDLLPTRVRDIERPHPRPCRQARCAGGRLNPPPKRRAKSARQERQDAAKFDTRGVRLPPQLCFMRLADDRQGFHWLVAKPTRRCPALKQNRLTHPADMRRQEDTTISAQFIVEHCDGGRLRSCQALCMLKPTLSACWWAQCLPQNVLGDFRDEWRWRWSHMIGLDLDRGSDT